MQHVPNVEVKFETDTFANYWLRLPTMVASNNLPDLVGLQSLRTVAREREGELAGTDLAAETLADQRFEIGFVVDDEDFPCGHDGDASGAKAWMRCFR